MIDRDTKQRLQTINIGGKDVRSYRAGVIINKSEKTRLLFGGAYTTNGFPEAAINPGLVNVGGADASFGLFKKVGERWVSFSVAAIQGRERKVGPPANRLFTGKYIGGGVLFSLGLRLTKVPFLS